jgi:hypothetical protein
LAPEIKKKLYLHLRKKLQAKQIEEQTEKANKQLEAAKNKMKALPNKQANKPAEIEQPKTKIIIRKFSEKFSLPKKE